MAGSRHDETYKKLFAFPRTVRDLLRGFVPRPWLDQIDLSTLEKLSAEYVSDELLKRHGDAVWGVRRRKGKQGLYLVVLLEFQSRVDPWMALRIGTYTHLLCEELVRNGKAPAGGPLPFVLPIVLYRGDPQWHAARSMPELLPGAAPHPVPQQPAQEYVLVDEQRVVKDTLPNDSAMSWILQTEQGRSRADLAHVLLRMRRLRGHAAVEPELHRVFADWVRRVWNRTAPAGAEEVPEGTPEEVEMSIEERVAEWPKQWMQEGIEQGIEQGIAQGLAQQRALLRRLAELRWGSETAGRVAGALERTVDPERLAEVGEAIMQCASGGELVERAARIAEGRDAP